MSQNYARYCGIEKKVLISSNEKKNIIVQSYDMNQLNKKKNISTFIPEINDPKKSNFFQDNLNQMANTPITI